MRSRPLCIAVLPVLIGCSGTAEGPEPASSSDCIVVFGIEPDVFSHLEGVRVIAPDVTNPDPPGCNRVLAAGHGAAGVAAQRWSCDSRIPDALFVVDPPVHQNKCDQTRPIPVLRYRRFPSQDQKEMAAIEGFDVWIERAGRPPKFETVDEPELYCRLWGGETPTATCLLPGDGKTWPMPADSEHPLADPGKAAWPWVLEAWKRP